MLLLELTEFDAELNSHHRIVIGAWEKRNFDDLYQLIEGIEGKSVDVVVWLNFLNFFGLYLVFWFILLLVCVLFFLKKVFSLFLFLYLLLGYRLNRSWVSCRFFHLLCLGQGCFFCFILLPSSGFTYMLSNQKFTPIRIETVHFWKIKDNCHFILKWIILISEWGQLKLQLKLFIVATLEVSPHFQRFLNYISNCFSKTYLQISQLDINALFDKFVLNYLKMKFS